MRALYTGAPVEANREARPLYRSLFEVDPKLPGMALLGEIFMRRSDGGALALFRLYEVRRDP
jgi:hypothetical protein